LAQQYECDDVDDEYEFDSSAIVLNEMSEL
jgi:hypothetical protein